MERVLSGIFHKYNCFRRRGWLRRFFKKRYFFTDFQNAVNLQPLDEFLCSTPEMKARDSHVPFLIFKPLNKLTETPADYVNNVVRHVTNPNIIDFTVISGKR